MRHVRLGKTGLKVSQQERELETVEALRPLAADAGMSMTQMAVAWVLQNPVVTAPIIGAGRPEQLDDSLAAADKGLDRGLKTRLTSSRSSTAWATTSARGESTNGPSRDPR